MLTAACFFLYFFFFFAISVLFTLDLQSTWILCLLNDILIPLEVVKEIIFMSVGLLAHTEVEDSIFIKVYPCGTKKSGKSISNLRSVYTS